MTPSKLYPYYSFVIPIKDEEESLPILYKELLSTIKKIGKTSEIIFIDDGSVDDSLLVIQNLAKINQQVSIIPFRTNFGKSAALAAGFQKAQGKILIMLDADLQDVPAEIPTLLGKLDEGFDLVTGWRKTRHDSLMKRWSSVLFNKGTALITGVHLHDFNCGLKVMKRTVMQDLSLHGELHRFIPLLAAKMRYKVAEVPILHRQRRFGKSKFGFERSWRGIIDLITILFLTGYISKPAHFFGRIGIFLFIVGFAMDLYVAMVKLITGTTQGHIPLLLAGILFIVVGTQFLSTGLIAEMITHLFQTAQKKESSFTNTQ